MARCIAICVTFSKNVVHVTTLDNDKLLGFQFDITLIPLSADSICRYAGRLVDDAGGVLITHMKCGLPQLSSL
jgi:hypothetical protein